MIINGTLESVHTNVTNIFSLSPDVSEMPSGISVPLITVSIAESKASRRLHSSFRSVGKLFIFCMKTFLPAASSLR